MLNPVTISPLLGVLVIALALTFGLVVGVLGYWYWLIYRPADLPWWPLAAPAPTGRHHLHDDTAQYRPRSAIELDKAATKVTMMYEPGRVPCSWHAESRSGFTSHCTACAIANDSTGILAAAR